MMAGALWTCPECSRQFANTNQWHSCVELALAEHLASRSASSIAVYREVQRAVEACGEIRIHPQKTRIAFIARMTFASVRLRLGDVDLSFITPHPVDDARIGAIELFGPTTFAHSLRIAIADDIDESVRGWLCSAWRRGTQETLDPKAALNAVMGHARSVLTIPLATRVRRIGGELGAGLPGYAVQALGVGARVVVRTPGHEPEPASVHEESVSFESDLLQQLGLGEGDPIDLFVRPA